MRYDRLIILFVVLLIIFAVLLIARWRADFVSMNPAKEQGLQNVSGDYKKDYIVLKAKLDSLERAVRGGDSLAQSGDNTAPSEYGMLSRIVTEAINRENLDAKAVWNMTNKNGIFVIGIPLSAEPVTDTLFVWSGFGLFPVSAYNVQGKNLSVVFEQSKEDFVRSNNFINVRYISKAD